MSVKLNRVGFEHAKALILAGEVQWDDRGMWSAHEPRTREKNDLVRERGIEEYSKWHLAIDDSKGPHTRTRYRFPLGDFERIHRCSILAAESRTGHYEDQEVWRAAETLRELIDEAELREAARRAA